MKFSLDLKAKGASQMTGNPKVIVVKIEVCIAIFEKKSSIIIYLLHILYKVHFVVVYISEW